MMRFFYVDMSHIVMNCFVNFLKSKDNHSLYRLKIKRNRKDPSQYTCLISIRLRQISQANYAR